MRDGWHILQRQRSGEVTQWKRVYPKKGYGLLARAWADWIWWAYVFPGSTLDAVLMDSGLTSTAKEAQQTLDEYFELVGEYE